MANITDNDRTEVILYERCPDTNTAPPTHESAQSDATKDKAISDVLRELINRPLFINLGYSSFGYNPTTRLLTDIADDCEVEVVGSSKDGLKTARIYDVGDVDMLVYAKVTFDATDEALFEYRPDNPLFFHIPLSDKFSHLPRVENKYLNASAVRGFDKILFGNKKREYSPSTFLFLPTNVVRSDFKCATTGILSYADPVQTSEHEAEENAIDNRHLFAWETEHVLFAYVLLHSNLDKLAFVRELIYGDKSDMETAGKVSETLKERFALIKQDFQRTNFNISDLLYFSSDQFQSVLDKAFDDDVSRTGDSLLASTVKPHGEYSADIVPAIRCRCWPRRAESFKYRIRIWPSTQVIDEIIEEGFRVVPKTSILDPIALKDFILSFSHADVKLVRLLPEEARIAYRLFKMCYKSAHDCLEGHNLLRTYHLKQALLWVAEQRQPESWIESGPLCGMRWIIEFLIICLRKMFFPSFYVEQSNHICHFSKADADAHITLFTKISSNPANFVKIVIDQEWEYMKATVPEDSYKKIRDPSYFAQFTWLELIRFYSYAHASLDGYSIDDMGQNMSKLKSEELYEKYLHDPFNTTPPNNIPFTSPFIDIQLEHVEIFLQTVTQMEIELFNVLDYPIDDEIIRHSNEWISKEKLVLYPQFNKEAGDQYGEYILNATRLRLKYYGNIYHILCNKLKAACFESSLSYKNQDAVYIIRFLKDLVMRRHLTGENIDDLLHYLFYFCHFTRIRHHKLVIGDQILRSIREFLHDARQLMTVYFNPRVVYPVPVDIGDKAKTCLGECFSRQQPVENQCGIQ
ncbi:uncharacterized protein LOC128208890 [Mya arenaria]|uniref:uncharacterized protein LOC128208890 n=1 Tax=Mya arenaria TaxID=6604 RepID=UPI0022E09A8E|nr:uncharacterized protein LOC128208890 [Mya arenaria]XP_052768539.1 uncharacterized protein LOC128208890 [Mya arenaria]